MAYVVTCYSTLFAVTLFRFESIPTGVDFFVLVGVYGLGVHLTYAWLSNAGMHISALSAKPINENGPVGDNKPELRLFMFFLGISILLVCLIYPFPPN